jgi:hypothetical protein
VNDRPPFNRIDTLNRGKMTSDAPQGSERWQASDGNMNQPQEQTGYAPPPPPGHAAPAGQTLGNATAPSTVGAAKFPVAAWLLFAGSAIFLSSDFLAKSILMGHVFADLLITTVVVALVWATFTQPRPRLWSLIMLTVYIAVEVFSGIVIYLNLTSRSAAPSVGLLVSMAAVALLVVGVIMAWIARSKTHPSAFS